MEIGISMELVGHSVWPAGKRHSLRNPNTKDKVENDNFIDPILILWPLHRHKHTCNLYLQMNEYTHTHTLYM